MKYVCLAILIAASCCSLVEGRFGLRPKRSLFDDPFFLKPWTTFDMMKRDFDDHFKNDPFFADDDDDDDDFDDFFHQPLMPPSTKTCSKAAKTDESQSESCVKVERPTDADIVIPHLAARVVKDDENQFKFAMNLKGFDRKEISVRVEDDFLKISGKKSCKDENKKCSQRSFFRYQYLLPKHSDLKNVKASFSKDNFLIVDVPKLSMIEDASGLKIEDLDEEYVPKLKEEMKKGEKSQVSDTKDEDVTVEDVPPTKL